MTLIDFLVQIMYFWRKLPPIRKDNTMIAFVRGALLFVLAVFFTESSFGLPRFAVRMGAKCETCHVDPTGGRMRNTMGITFGKDQLPLISTRDYDFGLDTQLTDNISMGGDFRFQFLNEEFQNTFTSQAMTATLYGAVKLGHKIRLFYKQDFINPGYGPNNEGLFSGPEMFGIGRVLPARWYIKGGVFLPDYGWRLDDHTSFVRGGNLGFLTGIPFNFGLIFVPNYKDVGLEVGGSIGNLFLTAGTFNGTGNLQPLRFSRHRAFVGKADYRVNVSSLKLRGGVSYYNYINFEMVGFTAGIGHKRFAILGEIDWTENSLQLNFGAGGPSYVIRGSRKTMAAYAELNVLAIDGVWGVVKYDLFDPNQGVGDNDVSRLTLGLEIFAYPMVEVRPQYRIEMENTDVDNNVFLVQTHLWF